MAKLIYKTYPTPKGHDFIKSSLEHEYDPKEEIQSDKALIASTLVNNTMEYLVTQLKHLGYDSTKVIFEITTK